IFFLFFFFFFFQAEDGIRDRNVTGVQTCALPIYRTADVLVCTTIIESGLDVPSANTLVVERADRLGLAQMYQLRGRVGRSAERRSEERRVGKECRCRWAACW